MVAKVVRKPRLIRLFNGKKADGTAFYGDDFRPESTGNNTSQPK